MVQHSEEYQNEYFKKEGYIFFENVQKAAKELCKNRRIKIEDAIEGIQDDTNCDCVVLNDGSVAVHPQSMLLIKDREQELYNKMKMGEITKLKYYLFERKLTVAELADKTEISKRTLDEYVSGRRELKTIQLEKGLKIAEALEMDIYDLL